MRFSFVLIFESLFRFLIHENDSYAYGVTRIYVNDTRMIRKWFMENSWDIHGNSRSE